MLEQGQLQKTHEELPAKKKAQECHEQQERGSAVAEEARSLAEAAEPSRRQQQAADRLATHQSLRPSCGGI